MDIFEKATRDKVRFVTTKGSATVEDLWDFSTKDLNTLAIGVNKLIKEETEEGFLHKKRTKASSENILKLDILKHIIDVKLEEDEAKKARSEQKAELELLESLMVEKKVETLKGMSMKELQAKIKSLKQETV